MINKTENAENFITTIPSYMWFTGIYVVSSLSSSFRHGFFGNKGAADAEHFSLNEFLRIFPALSSLGYLYLRYLGISEI